MAPKGKGKAKGKSFRWSLETTKALLNICLDHQKANGVDQMFSWVKISKELRQKIGKRCSNASVKNKFDHTKKLWLLWGELWQNEACRPRSVNDPWWDRKIKENENYKQFRKKVVPREIDDLCERIFSTIAATKQHSVASSRDPLEGDGGEEPQFQSEADAIKAEPQSQSGADAIKAEPQSPSEVDAIKAEPQSQSGADAIKAEPQSQSGADAIKAEPQSQSKADTISFGISGKLFPRVPEEVCLPSASKPKAPTRSMLKNSNGGRLSSSRASTKHKTKQSTGAAFYNPARALVGEASHETMTLPAGDLGILEAAVAPKEENTLDEAMFVIKRLEKEGSLVEGSPLWCFAVNEMLKDDVRHLFLAISRDSARFSWLQWRFQLAYPEMRDN